jgi:hypothetical protein
MVFDATGDVSKFIEVHNSKGMILNQSFFPSQFSASDPLMPMGQKFENLQVKNQWIFFFQKVYVNAHRYLEEALSLLERVSDLQNMDIITISLLFFYSIRAPLDLDFSVYSMNAGLAEL